MPLRTSRSHYRPRAASAASRTDDMLGSHRLPDTWSTIACGQRKTGAMWFDLAPDGKRAVILTSFVAQEAPKQEPEIVFLGNVFDYLRRTVPLGE